MKNIKMIAATMLLASAGIMSAEPAQSPDLSSLISGAGSAISNIVEGVFSSSDLTVADIAGEWKSTGSAVTFKSDNLLQKAGGLAIAGTVESQLDTYYQKYGLNNLVFTVENDGTFSLAFKKVSLKGTIAVKEKGVFTMKFTAFGTFSLGSMDAYVEKSGNTLNLMFDADKIKKILSLAASISGNSLVSTLDSLLEQYDGICMGFKMTKTADATSTTSTTTTTTTESSTSTESNALDALKGLFGK